MSIFTKVITKVFGNKSEKDLKKIKPFIEEINKKYNDLSDLSDSQLKYAATDVEFLIHLFREQRLFETKKLNWQKEELHFLISSLFSSIIEEETISHDLTKKEEKYILNKFNDVIKFISETEQINPTLFFSKKNQKDFIRITIDRGLEESLKEITQWRKELIEGSLQAILTPH